MSRPLRIVAIALAGMAGLVALYAAAGYWLLPRVLAGQVERLADEQLSLEARVTEVSFDPFRLRLVVQGFTMEPSGGQPTASFDELRVDVDAPALLGRRVILEELSLAGPFVELARTRDGPVVAGIPLTGGTGGGEDQKPPSEEPPAAAGEPSSESALTALVIHHLVLSGGRIRLADRTLEPPSTREIDSLDLDASDLDLSSLLRAEAAPAAGPATLKVDLGDGASLGVDGQLRVHPLQLALDIDLQRLALSTLQPWVEPFARVELRDGRLGLKGKLEIGSDAPGGMRFHGDLVVKTLAVGEPDVESPMVAWQSLDVGGIEVASEPLAIEVGAVDLRGLRVRLVQRDTGLNVTRAFSARDGETAAGEAPAKGETPQAPGPAIRIGPVHVTNGGFAFEDRTIEPAYHVELEALDLRADGFTTKPGGRTTLDAQARLDGYAPVALKGSLAPMAPREFLDLALSAKDVELSSFSPYAGRYVGRELEGGRGSLQVEVDVEKSRVVGRNEIVLQSVDFGRSVASPEATSLPVPTAAVLLADANGRIRLDLPVEGDLDDPGFSYTGTLVDTLRTLITRVVQTPFKMVGGMIALGDKLFRPEELEQAWFPAGRDALEGDEPTKLEAVAAMLVANPKLGIEIRGGAAPAADGDADLRVLARRRADAVRSRLEKEGVQPDRITIGDIDVSAKVEGERVRTQLRLR